MMTEDHLGPLPRIHPREQLVNEAEQKLRSAVVDAMKGEPFDSLTGAEYIAVINRVFSGQLASYTKFAIRQERHGDTDKPGGIA